MTILETLRGTAKCPKCRGTGDPTGWLPSPGKDPIMREFTCRSCGAKFYQLARDGEQLDNIRARQKALREKFNR